MKEMPWTFYLLCGVSVLVDDFWTPAAKSPYPWLRFVVFGIAWALLCAAGHVAFKAGRDGERSTF